MSFWAGTSAALVSQPQLGASLRKGWYRMIGTLVGAVAIVVLTAWFPQDRALFLVALALWAAGCALLATLLDNFASYAAALAGYTAAIIAADELGATGGPNADAVFLLAVYRASEICIGIVVPASFSPQRFGAPSAASPRYSRPYRSKSRAGLPACWGNRFACRVGTSWRVDETYVKIKGKWTYLYRAVDKQGKKVDFLLRAKRDVAAAKAFFRRAFKSQGRLPQKITLDGYQASHRAAREILGEHQRGK